MDYLEVYIGFIAGLFSLLGAFTGALLARKTDRLRWERENRSETFSTFLAKLSQAQDLGHSALFDTTLDAQQKAIQFTEAYIPLEHYARLVRLYLPVCVRDEFSQLVREIRMLHGSVREEGSGLIAMREKSERIQEILEEAISASAARKVYGCLRRAVSARLRF